MDNVVLRVVVVHNNECLVDGVETEAKGVSFCQSLFGSDTSWKQTSYNNTFRKNFASVGGTYDSSLNAFVPPKPFPSWVLNNETADWDPPVSYPDDGNVYTWNEASKSWVQV